MIVNFYDLIQMFDFMTRADAKLYSRPVVEIETPKYNHITKMGSLIELMDTIY